ncbi:MAG: SEL1-like repeat protein [Prevotella sp.]|nr:SEL1-like repeat protein [Prevotella sp.]
MQSNKYPSALKVGTRLNNDTYEIIKVLGQGGFGITYEAKDLHLNRHLAIKELFAKDVCGRGEDGKTVVVPLKATKDSFDYQMEKFKGEARILAGLHNKHLVTIYHFFKENGTSYFVMDYVEGKSLRDLLREVHHYDEYTVKDIILEQMLETLDCIHKQNPPLCHLDIKPENIMVNMNDFNIVLIDFGASKYASTSHDGKSNLSSMMVYSPYYAPIEQMSANAKKNMGPWSDFYALGATMYALLTGFDPNEPSEILADPSPTKEKSIPLPPSLSEQMKKLIVWMMSPSKGDRPQSVEEIRRFLGKGVGDARGGDLDPVEMFNRGEDCFYGKNGMAQDYAEALTWYYKAAEQGHAAAQNALGVMLQNGMGVETDEREAVEWYRKAAKQGNADAQSSLGFMYRNGRGGLPKSDDMAAEWYRKAADQGHAGAQNNLAFMYQYGFGVRQSNKEAFKWYEKAAAQNNTSALFNLAMMYVNVEGRPEKAVPLFEKAADNGHAGALYNLGVMYVAGRVVPEDLKHALDLFTKSAEKGNVHAQYQLAMMYMEGQGTGVDMEKAFAWLRKVAEQGHDKAQCELGKMYLGGIGVKRDVEVAREWLEKSAGQGNKEAQGILNGSSFVPELRKKAFLVSDGHDEFYLFSNGGYAKKGFKYELDESVVTFGRKAKTSTAVVQMEDSKQYMSRIQAEFAITYVGNLPMVTVKSVNASNLVKVNGNPLPMGRVKSLGNGDEMTMGDKTITLIIE